MSAPLENEGSLSQRYGITPTPGNIARTARLCGARTEEGLAVLGHADTDAARGDGR